MFRPTKRPLCCGLGCLLAAAPLLISASTARATDRFWSGGASDWFSSSNWQFGAVPGDGDVAYIQNGGRAFVNSPGAHADLINAGTNVGTGALIIQNGGGVSTFAISVGNNSLSGELAVLNPGSVLDCQNIFLGGGANAFGTVTVNGGGTINCSTVIQQTGLSTVSGVGSNWNANAFYFSAPNSVLSVAAGGTVTSTTGFEFGQTILNDSSAIEIRGTTGGILNAPNVHSVTSPSEPGTIRFIHSQNNYYFTNTGTAAGAPIDITGSIRVHSAFGSGVFSSSTLTGVGAYTGGTTVTAGELRAGSNAAFPANTDYIVGAANSTNFGTLDLNGFNLTMRSLSGGDFGRVQLGAATLTVDQASDTAFGGSISGTGTLIKRGVGTLTLNGAPGMPHTYTGGTVVRNGLLVVDGAALDQGGGSTVVGQLSSENGTLRIIDGGSISSGLVTVGVQNGSVGRVTIDGTDASWTSTGASFQVGAGGAGTLDLLNGGTVHHGVVVLGLTGTGVGVLNVGTGGGPGVVDANVIVGLNSATLNFNHNDAGYWFTRNGTFGGAAIQISGTVKVNHNGPGVTRLPGTHVHTGATTVNAGALLVNGTMTNSQITVNAGGTLGGSGAVRNVIVTGGAVAPGDSTGTLYINQSYNQSAASTLRIELGGTTPGTENDQLLLSGAATLAGTLDLSYVNSFVASQGQSFVVLSAGTLNGTFDTVIPPDGQDWTISYANNKVTVINGTCPDADGDGVCDADDICPGFDDAIDTDSDGTPDGCDMCPNRIPGDVNGDGVTTADDVAPFTAVLLNPAGATPDAACAADVNADGVADGVDIQAFINLIVGA